MTEQLSLTTFGAELPSGASSPDLWLGAASFEERCIASVGRLAALDLHPRICVVLDYPTSISPAGEGMRRRGRYRERIRQLASERAGCRFVTCPLDAYRPGPLIGLLDGLKQDAKIKEVVIDISCLTRVHLFTIATWLATDCTNWQPIIVHSVPLEYGAAQRYFARGSTWIDVRVAPLRFAPTEYERRANGIILPGHDAGRLRLALSELEVMDALVISSHTPGRAILAAVEKTRNHWLYDEIDHGNFRHWQRTSVSVFDAPKAQSLTSQMATRSAQENRRLGLFLFGPKPLAFSITLEAVQSCGDRVWYSYPVPASYDVDYTLGPGTAHWAKVVRA